MNVGHVTANMAANVFFIPTATYKDRHNCDLC
jgi:hypothetical protein